jgi:hypothetical protein
MKREGKTEIIQTASKDGCLPSIDDADRAQRIIRN